MRRMVNVAVLLAVLVVTTVPSTAFAGTYSSPRVSAETRGAAAFFEMFLRLIGFNPVSGATKSSPTPVSPSAPTPDTATWTGGPGKCLICG
jgi:hypothetical protein